MKKILIFFIFINNIISNNSFIYNKYYQLPIRYNLMQITPNRNNLKILNNNIHYHIHYHHHMANNTTNAVINVNTYLLLIISIYNIIKDFNFILLNLSIFIIQILVFVKIKKLI